MAGKGFAYEEFPVRIRGTPEEKVGADSDVEILTNKPNLTN
jgi:hypothetical protein